MKVLIESNTRRIAFYSTKVARIKLEFPFTVNIAKADDARRHPNFRCMSNGNLWTFFFLRFLP